MRIGIALSGGGIRGIAHAGVLKALEENGIQIDIIGGTSAGSLVAVLYAMGYSPYYIYILFKRYAEELVEISNGPIFSGLRNFMLNKKTCLKGLKTGTSLEKVYNQIAYKKGIRKINQIRMPIVIPTVDILNEKEYVFTNRIPYQATNKEQYITDITVGRAVRASSSFPAVFIPCEFKNHAFMDGGALDNVPVHEVRKQGADRVIAVKFDADPITEESNMMDIVMKTIDIMGSKIAEESLEMSDYVLNIRTDKVGLLDTEKLDSCYQYGYNCTMEKIEEIKKKLK